MHGNLIFDLLPSTIEVERIQFIIGLVVNKYYRKTIPLEPYSWLSNTEIISSFDSLSRSEKYNVCIEGNATLLNANNLKL
jgi:hypothetical protein